MQQIRVIPALLLKNEGLVKSVKFKDAKYIGDPRNAVKIFNEKEVDELAFLDISASINARGPNFQMISEISSECFMPLCYGGGITTIEQIRKLFSIGIEKVAINSALHSSPELVSIASDQYGSQSIIASIDVKKNFFGKYEVFAKSGTVNTKKEPARFAAQMQELGVGEILLNSIDRDGTMKGYDLELIKMVTSAIDIPLIACGGAACLQDMKEAVSVAGASAVAAGSMFVYHGKHKAVLISYPKHQEIRSIYE
ncbi:MAG TPA: AglZ/HisF2 family acetamidino modification protein [Sphingobacteriaceae bacterium]